MITKAAEEVAAKLGFVLVDAHFGQQGRKTSLEVSKQIALFYRGSFKM